MGTRPLSPPPPTAAEAPTENAGADAPAETTAEAPKLNKDIYPLNSDKTFTIAAGGDRTEIVDEIEQIIGVKLNYVNWTEEQVQLAMSSKELPDAFLLNWFAPTKSVLHEYGESGYFVNFMDYLDIMPNFAAFVEQYPEIMKAYMNEDGSVYNLPSYIRTPTMQGNLLYARKDMMAAAGWEKFPETTDEFLQCIKDLQAHYGADDPEFIAFTGHVRDAMNWNESITQFLMPSFGELMQPGLTVDDNGKVALGAATEQYMRLMVYMNEIFESGAFNKNVYTEDGNGSKALAAGGHLAISTSHFGMTTDLFESGNLELELIPPLSSEYSSTPRWYMAPGAAPYLFNAISTSCQDIETMCKFFDAFYSTEENPLNEEGDAWGILPFQGRYGIDFTFDRETGTYAELPHEGWETGTWNMTNSFGVYMYTGMDNGLWSYIGNPNVGVGVKGMGTRDKLWPVAVEVPDITSLTLTEDERDIYNDAWADINAYLGEMTAKFVTGEEDPVAYWSTYMENLEKMGLSDVLDIYQAAYDRSNG